MKLFPLLPRYMWHVRLSMLKINTHIQTCLHTFYQAAVKISKNCQMIILCNHGEVRNKTTFSRIISGLIAFDSCSMYLFTCLLNLGGCKCLGDPWSILFPLCLCVVLAVTEHTLPVTAGNSRALLYSWNDWRTATPMIKHDTFTSKLADRFWMFQFLSFLFFHPHYVKPILLKQRQLRKYFWWRVLKPPLPLPDFSLCTALWVISAISWDL